MADDTKAAWLNWLAITTIIFSACATLSTFKGGGYSTKAVMAQAKASDQWSYYQAKSVKQSAYQMQKDALELQLLTVADSTAAQAYRAKIGDYQSQVSRYDKEKNDIKAGADSLEASKAVFQKYSATFGLAVVFLQVAIMLSAIAALLKKKYVWILGVGIGVIGLVSFANGFWHFLG